MRACSPTAIAAGLAAIFLLNGIAMAGEAPAAASLCPKRQPLVVARAADPASIARLFESGQARALGFSGLDHSGRIPGMDTGPASWRSFIDSLIGGGATDFWYCMPQGGGVLDKRTAGLGWNWLPGTDAAQVGDWLRRQGFAVSRLAFDRTDGRGVAVAADAATLDELMGGGRTDGRREDWAGRLDGFMKENPDGVGVWFTPRPLIGALALATGFDLRGALAKLRLRQPSSASLDLLAGGENIGLAARFDGVLPDPPELSGDARLSLAVPPGQPEAIRLTLAAPGEYLKPLGLDRNWLYLANIDMRALIPRVATLTAWRDDDGGIHWSLACLMGDGAKFRRQWKRLTGWLDVLAMSERSNLQTEEAAGADGQTIRLARLGDFTMAAAVGDGDALAEGSALLLMAGWVEDLPRAGEIALRRDAAPRLIEWDVRLGERDRMAVAEEVAFQLRGIGHNSARPDLLAKAIPEREVGMAGIDGDAVVVSSPEGMAAWLAPVLPAVGQAVEDRLLLR